ncbi:unnamed protein product [Cyprideis torosa]|uniref:Senescence domain-containing protein n=1 Tax=Cyprideis torosa TaxID=163714 RepID=A0A7R8W535_9CRUS|nr:unnamed protein product [Cyprideis torosa]CAG0884842.1 unnamed protein product [Cyprideis torosa]
MLPDLSNPVAGRSVGVIFPESVPLEKRQELMKRLQELTAFQDYRGTSSIERSASAISAGILRGATAASATITQLANHYVARRASDASGAVDAFPPPGSALPPGTVPTSMATGFRVARTGGKGLMKLTGWMVQGVGYATQQLATWAAPKVERTGSQILSRATGLNEGQVKEKTGSGMEYIGQAVAGYRTVCMGLEQGARVIAKGLRDGSVVIVESKYGPHAGEVAGNALDTAGFVGMAAYNVQALGPEGIAMRLAKDIGKQVVTNQGKGKGGAPPVPPPPRPQ